MILNKLEFIYSFSLSQNFLFFHVTKKKIKLATLGLYKGIFKKNRLVEELLPKVRIKSNKKMVLNCTHNSSFLLTFFTGRRPSCWGVGT